MIELKTPCEGWFTLSAFRVDGNGDEVQGSRRPLVPPFRNLITDAGLDRMGNNGDWLTWCQVGSGSTAPSFGDTALVSRVAGTNTRQAESVSAQPSSPYYVARMNTYRFPAGAAAGNLTEVGIAWATTGSLFSRALVLDALGNPTTVTVLGDELLDVTYQFRQYIPEIDGTGSITLRSIVHSVVSRPLAANVGVASPSTAGWYLFLTGTSAGQTGSSGSAQGAYTGGLGTITATAPMGTAIAGAPTLAPLSYTPGSLFRDFTLSFSNSQGNDVGGIGSIRARMGIGFYQFGFTPKILKTADDTLSLTLRHSWSRKTI